MSHQLALAAVLTAFVLPLSAQTYIVDQLNQPGAHFTDLPPAIAAVPSGAVLLVRPGIYSPFSFQNKSLTIVGATCIVMVTSPVVIGPLQATQSVRIRGVTFAVSATAIPSVELRGCAGEVLIERSGNASAVSAPILIDGCANVHLYDCILSQPASGFVAAAAPTAYVTVRASAVEIANSRIQGLSFDIVSQPGGGGIEASQGSVVSVVGTSVKGGVSRGNLVAGPGNGGTAIAMSGGSVLEVAGDPAGTSPTQISGGPGSLHYSIPVCSAGGDGIALVGGSRARVLGATLAGGAGCQGSSAGLPLRADASSSLLHDPAARPPRAEASGSLLAQAIVTLTLRAKPGVLAGLSAGPTSILQPHALLSIGVLALPATSFVDVFTVPASGNLSIPVLVPAGIGVGTFVLGQFLTYDAGPQVFAASNSFVVVARPLGW